MSRPPSVTLKRVARPSGRIDFYVWVRYPDEDKSDDTIPIEGLHTDRDKPKAQAVVETYRAALRGGPVVLAAEAGAAWYRRYLDAHEGAGHQSRGMQGRWDLYVAPHLTSWPPTREQIIAVRDHLRDDRRLSPVTVLHIWIDCVVTPFGRAYTDKDSADYGTIRIGPATGNPVTNVAPPVTEKAAKAARRQRQYLEPSEFLRLVSCEAIRLERRIIWTLAIYTFMRPSELLAVEWGDVRLDGVRPRISVERTMDLRGGTIRNYGKTSAAFRDVPIHPSLLPLLVSMKRDTGRLIPTPEKIRDVERWPEQLRADLLTAGVTRATLQRASTRHLALDTRSLRTTGIAWADLLGVSTAWVQRWCGHEEETTLGAHYALAFRHFVDAPQRPPIDGENPPFPPLPFGVHRCAPNQGIIQESPKRERGQLPGTPETVEDSGVPCTPTDEQRPIATTDDAPRAHADQALRAAITEALAAGEDERAAVLMAELRRPRGASTIRRVK